MRRAWLRTSEGGPSLFCVCARACVCKHTCVHTGSRCKTDFLLGLESKNKHSLEHSVSNFHYILVTKLHFCGTLVLKPQKESLWPRRWDVPVHPGSPSSSHPRGSPNSHSDSASQESRQGVTCAPSGPGPPGPLGFPGWQRVCFPRNSTLQGCQAGPRGRFCAFPALHAPGEDSEVTWQLGRFLPAPSVPVALAIARSKWGGLFLGPPAEQKTKWVFAPWILSRPLAPGCEPNGWQDYGRLALWPVPLPDLCRPRGAQLLSPQPLHLPTSHRRAKINEPEAAASQSSSKQALGGDPTSSSHPGWGTRRVGLPLLILGGVNTRCDNRAKGGTVVSDQ